MREKPFQPYEVLKTQKENLQNARYTGNVIIIYCLMWKSRNI